ncbi:hypothetical protein QZN11_26925 [Streptomyces gramineus]|uniref:hypothetical protein n=1 Tax=Streptomyces gramineus TaxID=910542 RepID=UPI00398A7E85
MLTTGAITSSQPAVSRTVRGSSRNAPGSRSAREYGLPSPSTAARTAVRLGTRQAQVQLMTEANESGSAADAVDLDEIVRAEEQVARLQVLLEGHRYADNPAARRTFKREREQHPRKIETFKANREAADRLRVEAGTVCRTESRVHMRNFRIRPLEEAGGVKGRGAAGLRGTSSRSGSTGTRTASSATPTTGTARIGLTSVVS